MNRILFPLPTTSKSIISLLLQLLFPRLFVYQSGSVCARFAACIFGVALCAEEFRCTLRRWLYVDFGLLGSPLVVPKPHKHRLRLQAHAPDIKHFPLNLFFESHNIFGRCPAAIHDRQRVLARDPHRSA